MAMLEMVSCVSTATYDLTYETEGERGTKKPSGTAKRLLRIIERHGIGIIRDTMRDTMSDKPLEAPAHTL